MNISTFRTKVLLTLLVAAGCSTSPMAMADEPAFASSAVLFELSETRDEFSSLGPDEQSQVYIWLLANCGVDANVRRADLVKIGSRAELAQACSQDLAEDVSGASALSCLVNRSLD